MTQFVNPFGLLISLSLLLGGCSAEDRELTLAHSAEEPAPSIAQTIKAHLNAHGYAITLRKESAAKPGEIVAAVRDRRLDLAIVEESELPIPGVVTVAPLYPSVLHVLHKRSEEPADFADLVRGTSVYAGPVGGAAHRLMMQLSADFNVKPDQFRILDNPWTIEPDVYFILGGLLSGDSVEQLAGYRLFSFADVADLGNGSVVDGIVLKHHQFRPFVLPQSIYYTLNLKPVVSLSIRSVLVTHESLDTDIVFDIASQIFNNAQQIALDYPLVTSELTIDTNATELMFPLHPGSRRFLDRDKPGFIERYVDVLALVFTIFITLLSAGFALFRHGRQIKKDRVDVFYCQLLDIRKAMESSTATQDFTDFRTRTLGVQQEVLTLLIDERVAADSSLMAFLSLSNQMINELDRRIGYNA